MYKLIYPLILFLILLPQKLEKQTIHFSTSEFSLENKEALLKYMNETGTKLENEVLGLTEAQLKFKPSADSWSIGGIMEHISTTEKMLLNMTQEMLTQPENPEDRSKIQSTDEQLLQGMTDRSTKYKAPEMLHPNEKYNTAASAIKDFKEQRRAVTDFIRNNEKNLRNYVGESPGGFIDAYQSILFIGGHTARHTLQIQEIKAAPDFPAE